MIKFRQKDFAWPALAALANGAMIGGTVLSVAQGSKQAKQAEEQHKEALEAQQRENAKLTNALNNLAKEAKNNPQVAAQAGHIVGESKMFAVPSTVANSFFRNARQFGKDVLGAIRGEAVKVKTGKVLNGKKLHKYVRPTGINAVGKTVLGLGSAGVATAAVNYGVNKAQTVDARKIGMIPGKNVEQRSYAVPSSIMSKAGTYAKKAGKFLVSKENLKKSATWGAFGLIPAAGYIAERAQFKDQVRQQESMPRQKSYAVNMASIAKGVKGFAKNLNPKTWQITKTPLDTISGFASKSGSMFMIGKKEMLNFGNRLKANPNSGSWAKKTGEWITKKGPNGKYKNLWKANLGLGVTGGSVLTTAYGKSEKLTDKALRKIDKDAYSYEKHKNQQVQQ